MRACMHVCVGVCVCVCVCVSVSVREKSMVPLCMEGMKNVVEMLA